MRTSPLYLFVAAALVTLSGCAGSGLDPIDSSVGGVGQQGGAIGQGGASAGGAATNAGGKTSGTGGAANTNGGVQGVGGATNTVGGNASKGGSSATGGSTSMGGSVGTGGSSAPKGGSVGNGGATATGGAATGTGGAKATGGGTAANGGTTGTGGAKATGGANPAGGATTATGGAKATGGGAAAGGATATSGGSTGTGGTPIALTKFVGNITTNNSVNSASLVYSKYWNQITPENAGKWGSVQSSATSAFNWGTLDAIYDYCQKNNVIFKEHTFIWGSQQPGGSITETQVKNWMTAFCSRYPNTKLIDVVNEPPPHTTPGYANNIGGGTNGTWAWITNAFKWARAACPNAILILNDYNNIEWAGNQTNFVNIVKTIKAAGAPIDAVGAQAHDLDYAGMSLSTVKGLLTSLNSETGLPVYITEMDLDSSDDATQLNMYKQYLPLFLETEYVKGITIWGWIYGSTWSQAPNSGLVRNGTSRSSMTYIMGLLNRPAP